MSYVIRTHDGRALAIKQKDETKIHELTKRLELTAVELVSGEIVFLSKGTVARIEKDTNVYPEKVDVDHRIEAPDNRGTVSREKIESIRDALKRKDYKALKKQ